jgi:hypothetical protein
MTTTRRCSLALVLVWIGALPFATLRAGQTAASPSSTPSTVERSTPSGMFAVSGECMACHNNLVSPTGEDVSIGTSWRGTIMANSARDPYFHAAVRRETLDHPTRAKDIEDECAACHMPTAQKMAHAAGRQGEVFRYLPIAARAGEGDDQALAADGITCTVCHQIAADRLGTADSFNANFTIAPPLSDGTRQVLGPFAPNRGRSRIMHSVTGFEQVEAPHIRQSELCATCHTLITEALGPDGRAIGSLHEQMNYQEWRHSAFDEEKRGCQSCHMPAVDGPVRVSSVLGQDRATLSSHAFVGGNAFMLRILNRYRSELGVQATSGELEQTARATIRQLETQTASVAIESARLAAGALALDVRVTNLTGHKFPTGYPSRRAWLHVVARDGGGAVLFESGRLAPTGAVDGNDSDASGGAFEPHYVEITRAEQVQIYESIMGTPTGQPTTGLLQATQYLKDNRLLPRGFDKQTAPANIAVFGDAKEDPDFASAGDLVRYRVPLRASSGPVSVEVELRYQPIGFRWAQNLAPYDAPEPQRFLKYYNELSSISSVAVATARTTVTP